MSRDVGSAAGNRAEDRLCRTISAVLGVPADSLSDDASPDTVAEWDSMGHLNLVMALESEFGVSLSAEDALGMRNVAAIRRLLRGRGVQA
jgi:acyl carrier protein